MIKLPVPSKREAISKRVDFQLSPSCWGVAHNAVSVLFCKGAMRGGDCAGLFVRGCEGSL